VLVLPGENTYGKLDKFGDIEGDKKSIGLGP